ncbi:EamA family transporter [Escherichia albertii]
MSRKDGLLALLVVVVWGLNFVVIKVGLHNMPPLMLAGLRFLLVAFPAIFLYRDLKYRLICCWDTALLSVLGSLPFSFAP